MNFKMTTNIEYKIFDKAVKAIVTPTAFDKHFTLAATVYYNIHNKKMPKNKPDTSFVGIAKYREGDVFDIEKAKIIARKKAMRAAYSAYLNYSTAIYQGLELDLEYLESQIANISDKRKSVNDEIIKLTSK